MNIFSFDVLDRLVVDPNDPLVAELPGLKRYARLKFSTVSESELHQFVKDSFSMALAHQHSHSALQQRIHQWDRSAERLIGEIVQACIEKQQDQAFRLSHLNFAMALGVSPEIRLKSQDATSQIGRQVRFADQVVEQMKAGVNGAEHWSERKAFYKQSHLAVFHHQAVNFIQAIVKQAAASEIALNEFAKENEDKRFMDPMEFFALLSKAGVTHEQFLNGSSSGVKRQTLEQDLGF